MRPIPQALLLAALGFLAVNGAVEAYARATSLHERPVDLQSPNLFRARLDGFFDGPATRSRVVFAGDSVLAGRNLRETHGAGWEQLALPAATARASGGAVEVLNLGIEGVVWGDVECMVGELIRRGADGLVLHLNPRPFSADFDAADAQTTRRWLCDDDWATRAEAAVGEVVPVVKWRGLLQGELFGGPLRHRSVGLVRDVVAPAPEALSPEDAADEALLTEALFRVKAAGRYNDVAVGPEHASYRTLRRLLERLEEARIPAVLLYVGEDVDAIAPQLDRPHYDSQRQAFLRLLRREVEDTPTLSLLAIPREDLAGLYDDHVHLTADGYARAAAQVWGALGPLLPERPAAD